MKISKLGLVYSLLFVIPVYFSLIYKSGGICAGACLPVAFLPGLPWSLIPVFGYFIGPALNGIILYFIGKKIEFSKESIILKYIVGSLVVVLLMLNIIYLVK